MENNYYGYISLAELESLGRILYSNVKKENEIFHRQRMRDEGRKILVYPNDVFFVMETIGVPGLAGSWYHHLYPNKPLEKIKGGRDIFLGREDCIVWGQGKIDVIHMNSIRGDKQQNLELIVQFQFSRVNDLGEK